MARVLIVEDDPAIRDWLRLELLHEGYDVDAVGDGRAALEAARERFYDLVLLDMLLPGLTGLEVCRRLRTFSTVPVILVTARDAIPDKIAGLDSGADDYVTKPFAIEELLARVRAQLRRAHSARAGAGEPLRVGSLLVDPAKREAFVGEAPVTLTKTEFDLLAFLARNAGRVLSRDAILEAVWGFDFGGDSKVVDVYVRYLRAKIDEAFGRKFIHTVRGVGYVLKEEIPPSASAGS